MIDTELIRTVLHEGELPASIVAVALLVRAIGHAAGEIIWARRRDPRKS